MNTKVFHCSLFSLVCCSVLSAQVVIENFTNPAKNSNSGADGFLGTGGEGYNYNGNLGTWLYAGGNMGIDDPAAGDGSGSGNGNPVSSIGEARVQDERGTNARAISVVFDGSLFTHGEEYTVTFDVIGDSSLNANDAGAYWLAEVYGYDSGGTVQIDGTQAGWSNGSTKPFVGSGGATVNFLSDFVAITGENFAGTFPNSFTFTYDATNSPDIGFAVGTYNNIFAIDNFRIEGPEAAPTVTTTIQFGGEEGIIDDGNHITQIGDGSQIAQIIDWVGNSSEGSAASGSVGGGSASPTNSTLTSDTFGLTLTSLSFAGSGATGTQSSGDPNVLGVNSAGAAKFDDGSPNEAWTFEFNEDVTLRKLVFSALNFPGETVSLTIPGTLSTTFNRGDVDMAPVTFGNSASNRYVYTLPTPLELSAGTDVSLEAIQGSWGLQAVVVDFEYSPPPSTNPDPFNPNPDNGVEPASLNRLDPVPNVVIFIADDMGIGDTSAYQDLTGNADSVQIDTPEMERLANLGTRFTDVHTNAATCSPTRIALLSGTYSLRSPLKMAAIQDSIHTKGVVMPGRRTTMAHMMQRSGFATYGYGKWHMALRGDSGEDTNGDGVIDDPGSGEIAEGPIESGFDTYTGTPGNFSYAGAMIKDKQYMRFGNASADDYSLVPIIDPSAVSWEGRGPASPTDPNLYKVQPAVFEKLQTDLNTHMDSRANEPFFIYYASHSNHDPYVPANYDPDPENPTASLNGITITPNVTKAGGLIPINTVPDFSGDGIPDPDYGNNPGWIWSDPLREKWWDHVTLINSAGNFTVNGPTNRAMMVRENDIIVGYMLDFLEQTDDPRNPGFKLIDNTIFIFTSDNGADIKSEAAVGALPESGDNNSITDLTGFKGTRWEGGSRVPFIASWPDPADPGQATGIPAGLTSPAVFGLNDIYATIATAIGHRLHEQEAVDSESLLDHWTDPFQDTVDIRDIDMLSKYQALVFSRRGELKLAAEDSSYPGTLSPQTARQDRFADESTLDFLDMGFSELFDLSVDMSELNNLGPTEVAGSMLSDMTTYLTQGYSRPGAAAFENGVNFIGGGDLLDDSNWHAYKAERSGTAAGGTTPGIIAENGTASGDLINRTYVHRAATINYSPSSGGLIGSLYELDGGVLNVDEALRMRNSRLEVYRGTVALGANDLALNGGNCVVIISGGDTNAANLSVGEGGTSTGFKIVRFKGGAGTLNLSGDIGFGDDGDNTNDFIDFVAGSRGRLVSPAGSVNYAALWDLGQLRIDGVAGETGGFAMSDFKIISLGGGSEALVLADGGQIVDFDYDGDNISDVWEQETVSSMTVLSETGDNDSDGILDSDEYVLDFDPTSAEPPFAAFLNRNLDDSIDLSFASKSTRNYLVQFTNDLGSPEWMALNYEVGTDGTFILNHDPGTVSGFYEVRVFVP